MSDVRLSLVTNISQECYRRQSLDTTDGTMLQCYVLTPHTTPQPGQAARVSQD